MADQAQLKYNTSLTVNLDVLAVHGAAEPDRVSKFPGIVHEMLDGSLAEQIAGGRREISIAFQVMSSLNLRKALLWWMDSDPQVLTIVGQPGNFTSALSAGGALLAEKKYNYGVRAIDVIGGGIVTGANTKTTTAQNKTITLGWDAVTNTRCYAIYRQNETDALHWLIIDYTSDLTYVDAGAITDALAIKDLGHGIDPPAAGDHIHVITPPEYILDWMYGTELARMLTFEKLRERSIFTATEQFPV